MRRLVTIKFGSHLYGTSTPQSDVDLKSVYVPDAREILLQRVKGSINKSRPKSPGEKNYAGEIDEESYSLQRFLSLAAEGQTVALDVLFAPEWAMTEPPAPEWRGVMANRDKLITKKSKAFVGYCMKQAAKYGVKGSRVASARLALKVLDDGVAALGTTAKLREIGEIARNYARSTEHMNITQIEQPGGLMVDYWDVCGRLLQFTATIKHARDVVAGMVDEYGKRSLMAETNEGVDWKALSHAVRVSTQAIELLGTGHVTFPLANAQHIIAIKTGTIPYQEVAAEIEDLLDKVETAALTSALPDQPDHGWIDEIVLRIHAQEVVARFSSTGKRRAVDAKTEVRPLQPGPSLEGVQ